MLTDYLKAALVLAHYELMENGRFFGSIPPCPGVWAEAANLEACREELQEVLEGWVLLSVSKALPLPVVDGIDLSVKLVS